ncbi:MAG: arginine--tRNA ligase [Oligoflexia bacterium]|nr:arginine--tRNA ligase [Oligoflexia bacterium]
MSLENLHNSIKRHFVQLVKTRFGVETGDFQFSVPPDPKFGDLALGLAFNLAKALRKPPPVIAKEICAACGSIPGVREVRAEGPYLNLFLDRAVVLELLLSAERGSQNGDLKVIVEHTNINPNKAAHIGHLRNSVLGDTLVRMLRHLGYPVEVHNYIDDTGVQVADVVVGFEELDKKSLDQVKKIEGKFDYYCWDLYTKVGQFYEADKAREKLRQDTLLKIEHGGNPSAELARHIADRIVACHLNTMERLGVEYDVLPRESGILALKFWSKAFELLKASKAIYLAESGKNKGCWVMLSTDKSSSGDAEEQEKVIVRSNGTVSYVGKDIAYQLWKMGLLGLDFNYRELRKYPDGRALWDTTSEAGSPTHPKFGGAKRVYNVIDNRQSYLQKIVKQGLKALGYEKESDNTIHFTYEMVALTPACAAELGISLSAEDQQRSFVEMSGRKGVGVKADDLIDQLIARCRKEVQARNPELRKEKIEEIASTIAIGALRYFMLKHGEIHVLAFDFDQALAFEGETGPYLQNAVVRASSILRKLDEGKIAYLKALTEYKNRVGAIAAQIDDQQWEFLMSLARIDKVVAESVDRLQLSAAAKYAFTLAQKFHNFYHHYPILKEDNPALREARLFIVLFFLDRLQRLMQLLGVESPERM